MKNNKTTVTLAKSAGFCFGVARAVRICEQLATEGKQAVTIGPIIHNMQVVDRLRSEGIVPVDDIASIPEGAAVVVRSHGVPAEVMSRLRETGHAVVDATCPFVSAIHRIVARASENGRQVLVAGDPKHPEIVGIVGHCAEDVFVFDTKERLVQEVFPKTGDVPIILVAQTTFHLIQYQEVIQAARSLYTDIEVYETVCDATSERQNEAEQLAKQSDVCIVVGGRQSSNTRKLFELCSSHTVSYLVETASEILPLMISGAKRIGVTAGASTPAPIIEEVLTRMSEMQNDRVIETLGEVDEVEVFGAATIDPMDEMSEWTAGSGPKGNAATGGSDEEEEFNFEEALEDSLRATERNQRVVGIVTQVRPNEVVVDIGTKHTGIIPAEEMTDDSSAKLEDLVQVGDELDLLVIKTNDQEGLATLSKKRVDSAEGLELLMTAAETGETLDAHVTELVNKGLVAVVKGVRVFVPASQATLRRGENYDSLLHTDIRMKILEVNPARRRAIGSIRAVLQEELNSKRDAFWEKVENGQEYVGKVKSLTSYGAFVDLGGVDGMVHISELSWKRIKTPAEVVSVGDEVSVYVRDVDHDRRRISLGYRKEEDNPWKVLERTYQIGDVFDAHVVSLTKFGVFVRVIPGVDGLVHISEIANEHVEKASDFLSVGDEVMVKLIGVDYERRRISLSMRFDGAPAIERKPAPEPSSSEEAAEEIAEEIAEEAVMTETAAEAAEEAVAEAVEAVETAEEAAAEVTEEADAEAAPVEEAAEAAAEVEEAKE